jgi:PTS system mannose-specific IIB component/fructoselysine and glucoselysine-specific PTS system IIB component
MGKDLSMIQRIRIDDRLLHGQVAFSWKSKLDFNAIVIASDAAANDPMRKQIMKMCCPEGVKLAVRTVEDAAELLKNPRLESMRVFVVCPDPETVKRLLDLIPDRPLVNLGGMASGGASACSPAWCM